MYNSSGLVVECTKDWVTYTAYVESGNYYLMLREYIPTPINERKYPIYLQATAHKCTPSIQIFRYIFTFFSYIHR